MHVHVHMHACIYLLKQPDCCYHTDVDDLIRPQLPVYVIPELDSDLLPESPDADVFRYDGYIFESRLAVGYIHVVVSRSTLRLHLGGGDRIRTLRLT